MALLARPICLAPLRSAALRPVCRGPLLASFGVRRLSASASHGGGDGKAKQTKEELIANYPVKLPFGQLYTMKLMRGGELNVKLPDAPGQKQFRLHPHNSLADPFQKPTMALLFPGKSGRIAHAIFNEAKQAGTLDATRDAIEKFEIQFASPALQQGLSSPFANKQAKAKFLEDMLTGAGAPPGLIKQFHAMQEDKSLKLKRLRDIRRLFYQLLAEDRKERYGAILSAEPLTDAQYNAISSKMHKLVAPGEKLVIDREIVPDLVGGFMIRVGNRIQDLSVAKQIDRMEAHLRTFFASDPQAVDKVLAK